MQKGAEQLSVGRWTDFFDQTRFSNQVSMPITQKVYSHAIYLKNFRNNKAMWVKLENSRNEWKKLDYIRLESFSINQEIPFKVTPFPDLP